MVRRQEQTGSVTIIGATPTGSIDDGPGRRVGERDRLDAGEEQVRGISPVGAAIEGEVGQAVGPEVQEQGMGPPREAQLFRAPARLLPECNLPRLALTGVVGPPD